jgi:hypothetical protein
MLDLPIFLLKYNFFKKLYAKNYNFSGKLYVLNLLIKVKYVIEHIGIFIVLEIMCIFAVINVFTMKTTGYLRAYISALSNAHIGVVVLPYQKTSSHETSLYKGIEDGKREMRKDVNRLFCDFNKSTLSAKKIFKGQ